MINKKSEKWEKLFKLKKKEKIFQKDKNLLTIWIELIYPTRLNNKPNKYYFFFKKKKKENIYIFMYLTVDGFVLC